MLANRHDCNCLTLFVAAVFVLLLTPQSAGALPRRPAGAVPPQTVETSDLQLCNDPQATPDTKVPACTRVIDHPGPGTNLSEIYNHRGVAKVRFGDLGGAIEDFTEALNQNPNYFDALYNRGLAYHLGENYENAINDFSRALQVDNRSKKAAPVYNMRGLSLWDKGEYDRAIEDFGQAIKLNDTFAPAYVNRGKAYILSRQVDLAIADFNNAIELNRTKPLVYIHRGDARVQRADFTGAINDYSAAIGLDPRSWEAYSHRGEAWRLLHDLVKSIADNNKAVELNPNEKEAYNNRALTLKDQGKLDEAIADCDQAIMLDPAYDFAYATRGLIRRLKGNLAGSLTDLNKAVELNPRSPVALTLRGDTLRESGDYDSAMKDFNKTISILPDFVAAYTGRGLTYEKMGDSAKAKADFEKALNLPADVDAGLARPAQDVARTRLAALAAVEASLSQAAPYDLPIGAARGVRLGAAPPPKILETGYSFLKDIGGEEPGYGLYSYAILVNDNERSAKFLGDVLKAIPSVEETAAPHSRSTRSRTNVFYIPLQNKNAEELIRLSNSYQEDPAAFSATFAKNYYDYEMSRALLNHLCDSPAEEIKEVCYGDRSRGPYIFSHATPASIVGPVPPPFLFMDLSNVHERAFPEIVAAFRAQVKREDISDGAKIKTLKFKLLNITLEAADWLVPVQKAMANIVYSPSGQTEKDKK
jgi:tetratricopeptide (TPR) repeat protein